MQKFCTECGKPLENGHCPGCEPQNQSRLTSGETEKREIPSEHKLEKSVLKDISLPDHMPSEPSIRKRKRTPIYIAGTIIVATLAFYFLGGSSYISELIGGKKTETAEAEPKEYTKENTAIKSIRPSESKLSDPLKVKALWKQKQNDSSEIEATLTNADKEPLRVNLSNFSQINSAGEEEVLDNEDNRDNVIIEPGKEAKLVFLTSEANEDAPLPKTLVYDEPNGIRLKWNMSNFDDYQDEWLKKRLNYFITEYSEAAVEAINERDFYIVSDMIDYEDKRYEEVRTYIDHLDEKGIYEDHISTNVEKIKTINPHTWEVTLTEEFTIYKNGEANDRKFRSTCIVKLVDGDYKMGTLTKTEEI